VPALRRALHDRQRAVRTEGARAAASCQCVRAEEAVRILAVALDEPGWARAEQIMEALVRVGSPALPWVVSLISSTPRNEADCRRRLRAVELAGRLRSAAAVPKLRRPGA
jgi:hypothetical protein